MSNNTLPTDIRSIINKYVNGKATEKELEFLNIYYESFEGLPENLNSKSAEERKILKEEIFGRVNAGIAEQKKNNGIVKSMSSSRIWYRMAAAASLIICIAFSLYFFKYKPSSEIAKTTNPSNIITNDVAPGGNKAILQLADGSTIILDSANNGNIANQGQTKIIKIDGQLAYNTDGSNKEILYNTITTPRGGQYQLILADGSKVWLNAASSLRFPTNFVGKERNVTLTGEGYFEVAKNADMPFKVDVAGREEVEVLGTHFNVNAYSDEDFIKTTLLEGSVKVVAGNKFIVIEPGEQAISNKVSNLLTTNKAVNLEEVVAWKNGLFQFDNTDIKNVMLQIGRWYDMDIVFKGSMSNKKITGKIYRNVNVSNVLKLMEALKINFKIEGKTIIVTK